MKYLDFKNENVYLGHDKYLMEEFSGHSLFFSGTYLVVKNATQMTLRLIKFLYLWP